MEYTTCLIGAEPHSKQLSIMCNIKMKNRQWNSHNTSHLKSITAFFCSSSSVFVLCITDRIVTCLVWADERFCFVCLLGLFLDKCAREWSCVHALRSISVASFIPTKQQFWGTIHDSCRTHARPTLLSVERRRKNVVYASKERQTYLRRAVRPTLTINKTTGCQSTESPWSKTTYTSVHNNYMADRTTFSNCTLKNPTYS